jgi:ABC-type Zn uptake system ZnuABC Zn-binding protein ZnuA
MPTASEFAELENMSGAIMIWEAEPLPEVTARLTEMGITSVVFSPCATQPDSGADSGSDADNYLQVMQANVERIKNTLR